MSEFFIKQKPVFNVGRNEDIINLYKLALKTAKEQRSGFQQVLAGIVNLLLGFAYSANRLRTFEDMKVTNQVNKAKAIMSDTVQTKITCEEIAQRAGMGYSWFRRIFKQYTGFAPAQYMQELKINKSKELLTNTMLTCQEIAYEIGFETPSYFNISFKRKTGITPKEYRRQTQERML
jgi:AraC-like DNA-binding protein